MSEARVNNLSNESNTGGPTITGITTSTPAKISETDRKHMKKEEWKK